MVVPEPLEKVAAMSISAVTLLEAAMLVSFGFAWPIANLRMLRLRRAEGRGRLPTALVFLGYCAGISAKAVGAYHGVALAPVFWLYLLNAASVAMNLVLQLHYAGEPSTIATLNRASEAG